MAHTESSAPSSEVREVDATAVERQQEQAFVRKHGALNVRPNLLRKSSTKKRFDSGDWAMERMGLACDDTVPADVPVEQLSPKLGPEGIPLAPTRSRLEAAFLDAEGDKDVAEDMAHSL